MFDAGRTRTGQRAATLRPAAASLAEHGMVTHAGKTTTARASQSPAGRQHLDGCVPILPALDELLPEGLRRGEAVSVLTRGGAVDHLALSLLAGALHAGCGAPRSGWPGSAGSRWPNCSAPARTGPRASAVSWWSRTRGRAGLR